MFMNDLHRVFHDSGMTQYKIEKFFKKKSTLLIHNGLLFALRPSIHLFCQWIHFWELYLGIFLTQRII